MVDDCLGFLHYIFLWNVQDSQIILNNDNSDRSDLKIYIKINWVKSWFSEQFYNGEFTVNVSTKTSVLKTIMSNPKCWRNACW